VKHLKFRRTRKCTLHLALDCAFRGAVDSRLENVFKGKPKGFSAPSHAGFTHNSEYGLVIFEVETRITARYIPPGAEYQDGFSKFLY
jgi:hypothetical protein